MNIPKAKLKNAKLILDYGHKSIEFISFIENEEIVVEGQSIELTEENKLHLFCVAWHLTNFLEDAKKHNGDSAPNERIICDTCPHFLECFNKSSLYRYGHFKFLTKLTGVVFSAHADSIREKQINKVMKDLFIEGEKSHEK